MKLRRIALVCAATGNLFIGDAVRAADDTDTLKLIQKLQKRIDELEQKVKALEANQVPADAKNVGNTKQHFEELDQKVKAFQQKQELNAKEAPTEGASKFAINENGFSVTSANDDFALRLGAVLQVDTRTFFDRDSKMGNDGFLLRRARPVLQGTVFRDFDFLFVPDFGTANNGGNSGTAPTPQIFDAYLNYRFTPAFQLEAGKFKTPIGLEQLQADRDILFNERSLATDLVPTRDIGFEAHGDLFGGIISYGAGVFGGVGDGRNSSLSDFQNDRAFDGRIFSQPFKELKVPPLAGFGFGVGGSFQNIQGANAIALPNNSGYLTVGQEQFFIYSPTFKSPGVKSTPKVVASDNHWRLSPQGYYYYGPFGLMAEYVISDQGVSRTTAAPIRSAQLENTAWEISASWALTGEKAAFSGGLVPNHPFDPANGDWGAWQLVGRYSELSIDSAAFPLFADPTTSARSAQEWSVGLNWYLNYNIRLDLSFSRTTFEGGGGPGSSAPAIVTRQGEELLFTRLQLAF